MNGWHVCWGWLCVLLLAPVAVAEEPGGFLVPDGFQVSLYAGDELAHDIYSMTIDARGRVVVAGRGYVKILHDDNGDGRADRATLFASEPKQGARGLYFDGPDLICTGDDALARYRDQDGDGVADGPGEVLARLQQRGDHSANGVVKGPDGWFYVACGNDTGVTGQHITSPGSPVRRPHQGVVFRCSPDGRQAEVVAHGFRNPYDLAFGPDGALWMVDADGERDQYLPWYSPSRLFDVASGMHHGWMLPGWVRSWNRPPWLLDNVPRTVELGRGSPTGGIVYQHRQFPERYWGAKFSSCWSLGRIYALHVEPQADSYVGRDEVFLEPSGSAGFAPVALAVGPEGEMYVAIGGRGTRGSVYRIEYRGGDRPAAEPERSDLQAVLAADQPLASWSRARWIPLARRLGKEALVAALLDSTLPEPQRIRAIEVLTELFAGVPPAAAEQLARQDSAALRARLAWSLGRCAGPGGPDARAALLAQLTHDTHPQVKRHAWEALSDPSLLQAAAPSAHWSDLYEPRPRRVRAAALLAAARLEDATQIRPPDDARRELALLAGLWRKAFRDELGHEDAPAALETLRAAACSSFKLEAVRLMQLCLGDVRVEPTRPDVYAGYMANQPLDDNPTWLAAATPQLADALGSDSAELDRELARLLGMLAAGQEGLLETITRLWTEETAVEDDIHYLIVLSRLPGPRSRRVTRRTASALALLPHKMRRDRLQPSRFWPQRLGEAFDQLLGRDAALAAALVADPRFGLPGHSLFAARLDDADKRQAVRRIIRQLDDADQWTAELVRLTRALPGTQRRQLLHAVWDNPALRDTSALVLAGQPHEDDRPLLLETLEFGQPETIRVVADTLARLAAEPAPQEIAVGVSALRQFSGHPQYAEVCAALDRLLAVWSGQAAAPDDSPPEQRYQRWQAWLREAHPERARQLENTSAELDSWNQRLANIAWQQGDASRGRRVFQQRSCARCHEGNDRLGPELAGVAQRLSRDDLFTAILDPNRNVSPTYRLTQVITASGKIISGQVLYESPEATLVQSGPDTTVRITGQQIVALRKSLLSPMPSGLLRGASDRELADLYAWLRELGTGRQK